MSLKEQLVEDFNSSEFANIAERKAAFDNFLTQDFPTPKNEEWKFTNVNKLISTAFKSSTEPTISSSEIEQSVIKGLEENRIVFINGNYSQEYSSKEFPNGITVKPLSEISNDNTFNEYYNSTNEVVNAFESLNSALATDGTFIHIPKGKMIEAPISIVFINDAKTSPIISNVRNLIVCEEATNASFVESYFSFGSERHLTNSFSELFVKKSANINYYKLQNDQETASQVNTVNITQDEASVCSTSTITTNGELIRNNLNFKIDGEHVESNMDGLYLLKGKTHVDNHTTADHLKPNCNSNELYKGIMDDRSRGVFNGKIFVRQDAQKTEAFQSNKNVLLSDTAIINTKPQLEIWADDVSCSHGCTTGQLDEEALFYLQARGISRKQAQALLLNAFAQEVIDKIKVEPLRDYITNLIAQRLNY